jgi:nucleoside-diphosphate-sugar epimerase
LSIRNLLLTGASGSIGKKIFDELFQKKSKYAIRLLLRDSKKNRILFKKYKDDIEIIWGDLLNPLDIQKAVKNIEIIIHAAGVIPISKYNNPTNTYAVNVEGTKYLLSAVEQQKISPKVIYTSSIAVYGERLENPWIRISDPINPTYGDYYAESKVEAEKLIQDSKLDYCILRLSYCASTDILKFHPMLFRIPLITNIEIIGISDVAKVIVNILERNDIWGKIFNLGGGKECRIKYGDHLADLLEIIGLSRDFLKYY